MTNSALFREAVENAGIKYKFLAKALGITPYGLQKKIDNRSEFKASEIYLATEILNLSDSDRNAIFFCSESDYKSPIKKETRACPLDNGPSAAQPSA